MKKMKKLLAMTMALTMVLTMTACGGSDSSNSSSNSNTAAGSGTNTESTESKFLPGGGSNIAYIITPATSNAFFATESDVGAAKAKELGYEVKTVSHDDDASKQLEAVEAAISDKAAFIVLDNAGADASIEAIQAAYDAGIPCFLIDREINQSGLAVAQIVADNAQGAAAIAEVWVESMNYEGKYAELLGLESDTNCQVRSDNFHSVIDQYPDLEMVAQQSANWDQTEAYEKTESILESNPEITGIICGNDTMACGVAAACEDAGRSDIKIIGLDGSDDAGALIKAGKMIGTALQQCALFTEMAVEQADYYINHDGETLDGVGEKQLVPCVAITADNVDNLSKFVYTEE
ncbi:MAG: D-ribose ABC transporter substrate-binding protein [Clostridia bacterium]|nr:D-ribose ABC transporter substrate-binding protein [Clostridia bacterium]